MRIGGDPLESEIMTEKGLVGVCAAGVGAGLGRSLPYLSHIGRGVLTLTLGVAGGEADMLVVGEVGGDE